MSQNPTLILAAVGLLVIVGAMFWLAVRRGRRWRAAVRAAAEHYRLRYVAPQRTLTAIYDSASGTFEGRDIAIAIDEDERGRGANSRTLRWMKLEVGGAFSRELSLVERAARKKATRAVEVIDFSGGPGRDETPTGDAALDRRFAIKGAHPGGITALTGSLRPLLDALMEDELRVEGGEVVLRASRLPKTPEDLTRRLETMIALAKGLEEAGRR